MVCVHGFLTIVVNYGNGRVCRRSRKTLPFAYAHLLARETSFPLDPFMLRSHPAHSCFQPQHEQNSRQLSQLFTCITATVLFRMGLLPRTGSRRTCRHLHSHLPQPSFPVLYQASQLFSFQHVPFSLLSAH